MEEKKNLAFRKENYFIMLGGIVLLILGFITISMDKEPYGFGTLGLTVGPLMVFFSFIVQFFAIFYKPKKK